ncbi:hypothetical protein [Aurantibacillus circumpalustris]|uniref:hypothetical protein n=1 Tax=Aurantibacillus circumpalustris TaxID=3036359 RepID=UPI00295C10AC|nr:hypothetical protein [Aurantibacillus circumpalustris]
MEASINTPNENEPSSFSSNSTEKSELMQFFEYQVHDAYWAYKDLLKEIFENDNQAEA